MKSSSILTTIKAFAAADRPHSGKAPERSGTSTAGSFFRVKNIWRLAGEWFTMLCGCWMDDNAFREIFRSGSRIRGMTEVSLHSDI